MRIWKVFLFLLSISLSQGCVVAQSGKLPPQEQKRVKLLQSFCTYLQNTPQAQWDEKTLQLYIEVKDSVWITGSQKRELLQAVLNAFQKTIQSENLTDFEAVPWLKYSTQEKLPRMVWQDSPVTGISGHPIPAPQREKELQAGQRQLEHTLVVFRKSQPDRPLHYFLFDEKTGKIVSWVLIKQGGLHYFLRL